MLENLILGLPSIKEFHVTTHEVYLMLKKMAKEEIKKQFSEESSEAKNFNPFGKLALPFFKMGAITSVELFDLDELICFSFYFQNKWRYKKTLDIGGNIGLHSIIMNKVGFEVKVFEPDPTHFTMLNKNLQLNNCTKVTPYNAALSTYSGRADFVRVLGNTTLSHIEGCKKPYGELEKFSVRVESFKEQLSGIDFLKMDVEGHEKALLLTTESSDWGKLDAICEVGSKENAEAIFNHLRQIEVNAFSQKRGWQKVMALEDMPTSHKEGSLFISKKKEMPWG